MPNLLLFILPSQQVQLYDIGSSRSLSESSSVPFIKAFTERVSQYLEHTREGAIGAGWISGGLEGISRVQSTTSSVMHSPRHSPPASLNGHAMDESFTSAASSLNGDALNGLSRPPSEGDTLFIWGSNWIFTIRTDAPLSRAYLAGLDKSTMVRHRHRKRKGTADEAITESVNGASATVKEDGSEIDAEQSKSKSAYKFNTKFTTQFQHLLMVDMIPATTSRSTASSITGSPTTSRTTSTATNGAQLVIVERPYFSLVGHLPQSFNRPRYGGA